MVTPFFAKADTSSLKAGDVIVDRFTAKKRVGVAAIDAMAAPRGPIVESLLGACWTPCWLALGARVMTILPMLLLLRFPDFAPEICALLQPICSERRE